MTIQAIYQPGEDFALQQDAEDLLADFRSSFSIPLNDLGRPLIYFCGNSLGPQPKETPLVLNQVLEQWRTLAVRGHFSGEQPWITYYRQLLPQFAEILGALPDEVIPAGTLTANIHQLLASFYRPTGNRRKILAVGGGFPSDRYALESMLSLRGLDPAEVLLQIAPPPGKDLIDEAQFENVFHTQGQEIALVFFPAVHFATGQVFPLAEITRLAHRHGSLVGFDLAHATGNIPLHLHDWDVDFAAWCGYKYLCGGPGNGAGMFVHQHHTSRPDLQHLAGWWGNDPAQRFEMRVHFEPIFTAERFQLSNPIIFSLASMLAPLNLYQAARMENLRQKSMHMARYLEYLLDSTGNDGFRLISPRDPQARGCQLSVRVQADAAAVAEALLANGVIIDERPPDIIRIAPLPIYNTFHEIWRFVQIFSAVLAELPAR